MSITEIIQSVEFLVDAEGNKKAAVLEWAVWEELLALLEVELAGEQRWDEALANSQDALASLADEALAEYQAGQTQELVPDHGALP